MYMGGAPSITWNTSATFNTTSATFNTTYDTYRQDFPNFVYDLSTPRRRSPLDWLDAEVERVCRRAREVRT